MYLILIILNHSIATNKEIKAFTNILKGWASIVGVELDVKIKKIHDSQCTKGFNNWANVRKEQDCLRAKYPRKRFIKNPETEKFTNILFVRKVFTEKEGNILWSRIGGVGDLCYIGRADNPLSLIAYSKYHPQGSADIGFHEILHNWCEGHVDYVTGDPKNLMYPSYFDQLTGQYYISEDTKKNVQAYLSVL